MKTFKNSALLILLMFASPLKAHNCPNNNSNNLSWQSVVCHATVAACCALAVKITCGVYDWATGKSAEEKLSLQLEQERVEINQQIALAKNAEALASDLKIVELYCRHPEGNHNECKDMLKDFAQAAHLNSKIRAKLQTKNL